MCTAGSVGLASLAELDSAACEFGLRDRLMSHVNPVVVGRESISDGGSFTLSSGVLDRARIVVGSSVSMVDGAVNAFVGAAAIEMPCGQGIDALSPGVIEEAMEVYSPFSRGPEPALVARGRPGVCPEHRRRADRRGVPGRVTGQALLSQSLWLIAGSEESVRDAGRSAVVVRVPCAPRDLLVQPDNQTSGKKRMTGRYAPKV